MVINQEQDVFGLKVLIDFLVLFNVVEYLIVRDTELGLKGVGTAYFSKKVVTLKGRLSCKFLPQLFNMNLRLSHKLYHLKDIFHQNSLLMRILSETARLRRAN